MGLININSRVNLISVSRVGSFIHLICRILDKIFTIKPFLSMFKIGQIIKYIDKSCLLWGYLFFSQKCEGGAVSQTVGT